HPGAGWRSPRRVAPIRRPPARVHRAVRPGGQADRASDGEGAAARHCRSRRRGDGEQPGSTGVVAGAGAGQGGRAPLAVRGHRGVRLRPVLLSVERLITRGADTDMERWINADQVRRHVPRGRTLPERFDDFLRASLPFRVEWNDLDAYGLKLSATKEALS